MDRNKELLKNTLILSIGQLLPKFMAIITLPILTTYLTKVEYGTYDLVTSLTSFLMPLVTLQIHQAIFRYLLSAQNAEDKESYITNSLIFLFTSSVVCVPVIYAGLRIAKIESISALLICLILVSEAFYTLLGQVVRGIGGNVHYSIGTIVYAFVNMFVIVVGVFFMRKGLTGVLLAILVSYSLSSIYLLCNTGAFRYIRFSRKNIKEIRLLLSFSLPLVPSAISLWVVNLSDRLVVTSVLGKGLNGIYSVANKIPNLYSLAYNIFNLAWTETATKAYSDKNSTEYYTELFHRLFHFLIGSILLLIAATPVLFKLLINKQYEEAYFQIPILYLGVFFNSIVLFYSGIYVALKRTKQVGISSFVGAVLNLVINIATIHTIGLYAASVSTAVSYFTIAVFRAFDLGKVIKIKYEYKKLIPCFGVFCLSAALCFQKQMVLNVLNVAIALIYNLVFNRFMISSAIKMVQGKLVKKGK